MKLCLTILSITLLGTCAANAQAYYAPMKAPAGAVNTVVKLPAEVQVEFKLDFPKATDVYWENEYGGTYTASFIDTTVINVTYSSAGYRLYTEAQMTPRQLPAKVTKDINRRYPGWTIMTARTVTDSKGVVTFNALVQRDDKKNSYEVNYHTNGSFICSSPPLPKIVQ